MARRHKDDRGPIPMPSDDGLPLQIDHGQDGVLPGTADTSAYQPGSVMGAVVVHHLVTAGLVLLSLALGTWGYLTFKDAGDGMFAASSERPFEDAAVTAQTQRIHFGLAVFHSLYGNYPPELEGVVDEGLLQPSDLRHPPGPSAIVYERVGDTYRLVVQKTVVASPDDVEVPSEEAPAAEAPPKIDPTTE